MYPIMMLHRIAAVSLLLAGTAAAQTNALQTRDLLRMRSVGDVEFSPDGARLAYTVMNNDGTGRPYSQLWILNLAGGNPVRLAAEKEASSEPAWSPDGQWIAYSGHAAGKSGLVIAHPDGG